MTARAVTGRATTAAGSAKAARGTQALDGAGDLAAPASGCSEGICTSPPAHRALAAQLSADIQGALRGRAGDYAVSPCTTR